jgi:tRNA pseudouridine13 synthase
MPWNLNVLACVVDPTSSYLFAPFLQVTAFMLHPSRMAALNARLRGMRVGNFEFAAEQLRLGDLQGNRFQLVLRDIPADSAEAVVAAADGLRRSGFINYYGLQRFGTGAVRTHRQANVQ